MKREILLPLVAMLAVTGIHAQETSSRGVQEVQASFSTLKVMINEIRTNMKAIETTANNAWTRSGDALTAANNAQIDATKALTLANAMDKCGSKMKFYDSDKRYPDLQDSNHCVDGEEIIQTANAYTHKMKDGESIDIEKKPNMVLQFTCSTSYYTETIGGGKDNHDIGCRGGGGYKIQFAQPGGYVDAFSGVFDNPIMAECSGNESVTMSMFVYNNRLYKGSPMVTPAGVRVVNKDDFMNMSNWNGKVRAQADVPRRCVMQVVRY